MTGRSERRPNDPMLILFRVRTCHMPEEAEPSLSLSDTVGNWRTAGSLPDSKVGDVLGIRNPKDFRERPRVKSILSD